MRTGLPTIPHLHAISHIQRLPILVTRIRESKALGSTVPSTALVLVLYDQPSTVRSTEYSYLVQFSADESIYSYYFIIFKFDPSV